MAELRLAVVVLNYRTPDLVVDCLASLEDELDPERDTVIVVDNDSGDGSAEAISRTMAERAWGGWARLVESGRNGGFSFGNNVGMKSARADYYLLLNSDTVVRPGAIAGLLRVMSDHPEIGLLGPRLEWPDGEGQISAFRDISPLGQLLKAAETGALSRQLMAHVVAIELDEDTDPQWLSFACVMLRREVLRSVGLMDEGYFMYFEDADYARRVRAAGWKVRQWPQAHVVHLRGGSSPVKELSRLRKRLPRYYYESRARYFRRHFGRAGLLAANVFWILGLGIARLRQVIHRRAIRSPAFSWRDIWTGTLS